MKKLIPAAGAAAGLTLFAASILTAKAILPIPAEFRILPVKAEIKTEEARVSDAKYYLSNYEKPEVFDPAHSPSF
ncbi:MAG: hypothetical protein HUJ54_12315 [Erysipelotrichaceae bacterium]|nr:hypothetical protein [Erysipelotrichaceae bacterium]